MALSFQKLCESLPDKSSNPIPEKVQYLPWCGGLCEACAPSSESEKLSIYNQLLNVFNFIATNCATGAKASLVARRDVYIAVEETWLFAGRTEYTYVWMVDACEEHGGNPSENIFIPLEVVVPGGTSDSCIGARTSERFHGAVLQPKHDAWIEPYASTPLFPPFDYRGIGSCSVFNEEVFAAKLAKNEADTLMFHLLNTKGTWHASQFGPDAGAIGAVEVTDISSSRSLHDMAMLIHKPTQPPLRAFRGGPLLEK